MSKETEKSEIRILAQPSARGESCSFVMYPPLYEGITASFRSVEEAKGSPLPEALFALGDVERVLIAPNKLTVFRKTAEGDWAEIGKRIGHTIRSHHASGERVVSEEVCRRIEESSDLATRVQEVLDTEVNPAIAGHGGYIALLEVKGNDIYLQMGGGCQGCGMASATLRQGVESVLRQHVPQIGAIYDTTDHAAGDNPYYQPTG